VRAGDLLLDELIPVFLDDPLSQNPKYCVRRMA
jgi:hypothetical protein